MSVRVRACACVRVCVLACVYVCVCVCSRARARMCGCVDAWVRARHGGISYCDGSSSSNTGPSSARICARFVRAPSCS